MSIYQACDIRGRADRELTDELVQRIGWALGTLYTGQTVLVGGDVRLTTEKYKIILTEALLESGCNVLDIGIVATPVFYYAYKKMNLNGGVMVTASHNPPEYNGFKLLFGSEPTREEQIQQISRLVDEGARTYGQGQKTTLDVGQDYLNDTAKWFTFHQPLKVVVDGGNGAASLFAPELYQRAGLEVIELFCEPDGRFPNRKPNPALPENLVALTEAVREHHADVGVAFDGDGDRVGIVSEQGDVVPTEFIMALIAQQALAGEKGAIIYDSKCPLVVPETVRKMGGKAVMARAGHTFSKQAFLDEQALFAGEISGHFFFRELGYDDGMFGGLKVCQLIAERGSLSQQIAQFPQSVLTPDIRVRYEAGDKALVLDELADALKEYKPNRIDGVRLDFDDAWGLIRSSVTEPLFTLRFEAKNETALKKVMTVFLKALPERVRQPIEAELTSWINEVSSCKFTC